MFLQHCLFNRPTAPNQLMRQAHSIVADCFPSAQAIAGDFSEILSRNEAVKEQQVSESPRVASRVRKPECVDPERIELRKTRWQPGATCG